MIAAHSSPVRFVLSPFDDIRLKLNTACNWKCHFCHQEGNPTAGNLSWTPDLEHLLDALHQELGVQTVHLTGGEPTLHPQLLEFVARLRRKSFQVRMTSNGTFPTTLLAKLQQAGLQSLNVSILALDAAVFAKLHANKRTEAWAEQQIETATQNVIAAAKLGIGVHVNSTISRTNEHWRAVFAFGKQHAIPIRFQDDLSVTGSDAHDALRYIVGEIGARLVEVRQKHLTSRVTHVFEDASGYQFAVKSIAPVQFSPICRGCTKQAECTEWFYTLRIEQGTPVSVRMCIHRTDGATVVPAREFLRSLQYTHLKGLVGLRQDVRHAA